MACVRCSRSLSWRWGSGAQAQSCLARRWCPDGRTIPPSLLVRVDQVIDRFRRGTRGCSVKTGVPRQRTCHGRGPVCVTEPVKNPGVCGLALLSLNTLAKHEKEERRERDTGCTHPLKNDRFGDRDGPYRRPPSLIKGAPDRAPYRYVCRRSAVLPASHSPARCPCG
jgi:hypothetical protein